MKKMMQGLAAKAQGLMVQARNAVNNERGAQTIEWVALALVILFLMAAVSTAMKGNGGDIASSMVNKISELIKRVGSE
ncbi:hypothetical protein FIU87_03775 [Bacillus sp. THAF10]|uniref:hypothetical protein n=1 Tax=Bacillus sp. THAF10 TaxID=2587848 RepID=UPI001268FE28|nr:hypothetical protein [Bacillus sp. THAF10]QFT87763.1 hypothetical protein FIU87_03775 [Bacillus sp. THAF10]